MHSATFLLALTCSIVTINAKCSDPSARPDDGEIAIYNGIDCSGSYLNIGALFSCQNWPDKNCCSAITRDPTVTCDIYASDNCDDDFIARVDSAGFRNFCGDGGVRNIQSVNCWV